MSERDMLRAVSQRLFSLVKEQGRLLVLLDRFNPLPATLVDAIEGAGISQDGQCALKDPMFRDAGARAPLLLCLTVRQAPLIDELASQALVAALDASQPACAVGGFLAAPGFSIQQVARHLSRQLNPRITGSRKMFLRFYDNRVFPGLYAAFDAVQRASLLGPIEGWALIDRHGRLSEFGGPAGGAPYAHLSLDDRTMRDLLRIEPFNLAIRRLQQAGQEIPPEADKVLTEALAQAQSLGLESAEDLAAYAVLAWQWPANLGAMERHPLVLEGLQLARKSLPLRDYISERVSPHLRTTQTSKAFT